jgi:hypothetical protein
MQDSKWLAGAFSAYGLADNLGRRKRVSLFTTAEDKEYTTLFKEKSGLGYTKPFKGRWHWVCDDPNEIKTFYTAVAPHLTSRRKEMIEGAWEEWRRKVAEDPEGYDPGEITGTELYPDLHKDV